MILNSNQFQRSIDAKIQLDISYGNFGQVTPQISDVITQYIKNIPFLNTTAPYHSVVHTDAQIAKDNFISYWTRTQKLDRNTLSDIWENSIYEGINYDRLNIPCLVLDNRGVMTQDSFCNMIYRVCNS